MNPYYCYIKDSSISYLKTINNLVKNSINKAANKKYLMPFNYLESEKLGKQGEP